MNIEEITEILKLHEQWLAGDGGARADLRYADLRCADLKGADLRYADLRYANLQGADLRRADLRRADLYRAYLSGAYLSGAYLRDADLRSADLRCADLRRADLRRADLRGITVNWQSHQLLSEILFRSAGDDFGKRSIAGLIRISTDWCWAEFVARFDADQQDWIKSVFLSLVKDGDEAPEEITC